MKPQSGTEMKAADQDVHVVPLFLFFHSTIFFRKKKKKHFSSTVEGFQENIRNQYLKSYVTNGSLDFVKLENISTAKKKNKKLKINKK